MLPEIPRSVTRSPLPDPDFRSRGIRRSEPRSRTRCRDILATLRPATLSAEIGVTGWGRPASLDQRYPAAYAVAGSAYPAENRAGAWPL